VDDVHGDLDGQGDCSLPQAIVVGGVYTCSFTATVSGNAGDSETDTVTATGHDDDGSPVSASDDATVTITDVRPDIEVTKSASVDEIRAPGGDVTWTVTVRNVVSEDLKIVRIVDDKLGNLDDPDNEQLKENTCADRAGDTLRAGATLRCRFTARIEGKAGDVHVNTVTVTVTDDDPPRAVSASGQVGPAAGTTVSSTDTARVRFVARDGQPSTDMLLPIVPIGRDPLDPRLAWSLWLALSVVLILLSGWVIRERRRQRT
jgi:hypothetical protein